MLKKFLMLPVCCLVLLALALPAQAKEMKFAHFSIDVPADCKVQEKDGTVTVTASKDAFFSIALFTKSEAKNLSDKDFAAKLSQQLKGTPPEPSEDGGWTFTVTSNRVLMNVDVVGDKDYLMMFMSDASDKEWPASLQTAYDSVTGNDDKIDTFLKKTLFPE
ncbi:MAG: hypothetical protein QM579_05080 [Desulfovibrio sp.]|uniref:hypothetical protein n=1 Tax=Desulfovibrio sp. TaxID=885 RepID=UPI0039E60A62